MMLTGGLEDDVGDVLRKAARGLGISLAQLSERTGVSECTLRTAAERSFSPETWRAFAEVLHLNAEALGGHASYRPIAPEVPWVHRLEMPFGEGSVNAWMLELDGSLVLFDAGFVSRELLAVVDARFGRCPDRVFITHSHRDHMAAAGHLATAGVPIHSAALPQTIPMQPGDVVFCGPHAVKAVDLSGHCTPSLGFVFEGTKPPILIAGDALFAGSIGGCAHPPAYQRALRNLRAVLDALPPQTLILPGHGPATTLKNESLHNPFL